MIQTWGSWEEFQAVLEVLGALSSKYRASLANIAIRWLLQQPAVGAVIVGTRLGVSEHGNSNVRVFEFELDETDMTAISEVCCDVGGAKTKKLFEKLGDCGHEYQAMH